MTIQLQKHEHRHCLGRDTFHGQRGRLRQRYRQGQEDQLSALGLVLNAIVLWDAIYMTDAINTLPQPPQAGDLQRLSPLASKHINMLGRFHFELPTRTQWPTTAAQDPRAATTHRLTPSQTTRFRSTTTDGPSPSHKGSRWHAALLLCLRMRAVGVPRSRRPGVCLAGRSVTAHAPGFVPATLASKERICHKPRRAGLLWPSQSRTVKPAGRPAHWDVLWPHDESGWLGPADSMPCSLGESAAVNLSSIRAPSRIAI